MKQMLIEQGYKSDRITVLYDKPFMNINSSYSQRVELYKRLSKDLPTYSHPFIDTIIQNTEKVICGVSSTSWTPDEDFSVFLFSVSLYPLLSKSDFKIQRSGSNKICPPLSWNCAFLIFAPSEHRTLNLLCSIDGAADFMHGPGWNLREAFLSVKGTIFWWMWTSISCPIPIPIKCL